MGERVKDLWVVLEIADVKHLLRVLKIVLALLLQLGVQAVRAAEVCDSVESNASAIRAWSPARARAGLAWDATADADACTAQDNDPLTFLDELHRVVPRAVLR
jgi:hypothetical protein